LLGGLQFSWSDTQGARNSFEIQQVGFVEDTKNSKKS